MDVPPGSFDSGGADGVDGFCVPPGVRDALSDLVFDLCDALGACHLPCAAPRRQTPLQLWRRPLLRRGLTAAAESATTAGRARTSLLAATPSRSKVSAALPERSLHWPSRRSRAASADEPDEFTALLHCASECLLPPQAAAAAAAALGTAAPLEQARTPTAC